MRGGVCRGVLGSDTEVGCCSWPYAIPVAVPGAQVIGDDSAEWGEYPPVGGVVEGLLAEFSLFAVTKGLGGPKGLLGVSKGLGVTKGLLRGGVVSKGVSKGMVVTEVSKGMVIVGVSKGMVCWGVSKGMTAFFIWARLSFVPSSRARTYGHKLTIAK